MRPVPVLLFVALLGCNGDGKDTDTTDPPTDTTTETGTPPPPNDDDGDGFSADEDCVDADPLSYPGADERCDGRDNDCDGSPDEPTQLVTVTDGESFATIAEALAAAPDDGTITICGGTYPEAVEIDRSVTVIGIDLPTIDAGGIGPAFDITGGTVRLEGLRMVGGTGSINGPLVTNGGGVNAYGADGPVDLVDCIVEDNLAELGGGVLFGDAGGSLVRTVVRLNVAGLHGGGVYAAGDLTIDTSEISDNVASTYGGGLGVGDNALVDLVGASILGNQGDLGGGIFSFQGGRILADAASVIGENTGTSGGGGVYLWDAELVGGQVSDNDGGPAGGGAYVLDGGAVESVVLTRNLATDGAGLLVRGPVSLADSTIESNVASNNAGGVYLLEAEVDADGSTVGSNESGARGGGLYLLDSRWTGGTVEGNLSNEGGGAYITGIGTGASQLLSVAIDGNTALTSGGGVFAGGTYEIGQSSIDRNTSQERGAGLYSTFGATGTVTDTSVAINAAVERGGGVYLNDGSVGTFTNCVLDRNQALRGAGIYLNLSTMTLIGGAVTANGSAATVSGGGARLLESSVLVSSCAEWGENLSENVPDDVYVEVIGPYLGYGTCATFTCDLVGGCTPAP